MKTMSNDDEHRLLLLPYFILMQSLSMWTI